MCALTKTIWQSCLEGLAVQKLICDLGSCVAKVCMVFLFFSSGFFLLLDGFLFLLIDLVDSPPDPFTKPYNFHVLRKGCVNSIHVIGVFFFGGYVSASGSVKHPI